MLKKRPATESFHNPPLVQLDELLAASAEGQLDNLPIPNLHDSPYDTSTVNPTGYTGRPHPVHDVREAAQPTFSGWENNTIVRGTFGFVLNSATSSVNVVADAVRFGAPQLPPQRMLTVGLYAFNSLNGDTIDQFSSLGRRRVVADVRLHRQNIGGIVSHDGVMLSILAIDRAFDGNAGILDDGEMAFVEGEVVDYTSASHIEGEHKQRPSITILRPDGFSQQILLADEEQLIFGSVRRTAVTSTTREADIHPKHALPGDYVHIMTRAVKRRSSSDLRALSEASMHLQEGSIDRISTALSEQNRLNTLIDSLDTTEDLDQTRKLIAQYVIDSMQIEDGQFAGGISIERRRELITKMGDKFPQRLLPTTEMPTILTMQQETAYELLQAFGKTPLSKTSSQCIDFCREVARGEHITGNALAYEYILKISSALATLRNEVAVGAVRWFYNSFAQASRETEISKEQALAASTVMKTALNELAHVKSEKNIAAPLVHIVLDAFEDNPGVPGLQELSTTALLESFIRCGIWTDGEGAKYRNLAENPSAADVFAIRFDTAYRTYREAMPKIMSLLRKAESGGRLRNPQRPSNSPFTVLIRGLEVVTAKFLAIDPDTPDTNPEPGRS